MARQETFEALVARVNSTAHIAPIERTIMKTRNDFQFPESRGATSQYDWDTILSGEPVECAIGKDFECKPLTFLTLARTAAQRRGQTIRTAGVDKKGRVATGDEVVAYVIKAESASPDQIAKWDTVSAERKEKAKAAREQKKAEKDAATATA